MLIGPGSGGVLWIHRYPTPKPAAATKIQRGRFSALSSLDSYYHWILISSIVEEDTKSWYRYEIAAHDPPPPIRSPYLPC